MNGTGLAGGSESHGCAGRNHRRSSCLHGPDDLAAVDALQVDGGDPEVAVAELALDDDQRHAFTSQLDGVRVAQLVRREAPPNASRDGGPAQVRPGTALDQWRPRVAPLITHNNGPTGSSTNLAAPTAFSAPH
jgi:hypothetical protein